MPQLTSGKGEQIERMLQAKTAQSICGHFAVKCETGKVKKRKD